MSYIKIISVEPPGQTVDLAEEDSALAFDIAQQLRLSIADVLREGNYAFSLCRMRGENGYWAIFQRESRKT